MDIDTAKRIWASDEGYVKINNYFCKYGTYSKINNSNVVIYLQNMKEINILFH